MPIDTTAPVSANQKAVIKKYGFEVFDKDGTWYVNDEVAYRKNALKDASKKGRYEGKTLDDALKIAVEVRKELEGNGIATPAKTEPEPEPESDVIPIKKLTKGKKAKAEKKEPKVKTPREKKDHRFLRAFRVIAADPKATPEVIANKATMSVKMAGGCILAWKAAMQVLEEQKPKSTTTKVKTKG